MRELIIETQETPTEIVVRITKQSHRWLEFTPTGNTFTASNGFNLISAHEPCDSINVLYTLGEYATDDGNRTVVMPNNLNRREWKRQLLTAVKEYNEAYGITEVVEPRCLVRRHPSLITDEL